MRRSSPMFLSSILSAFILLACSQGGSPLGVEEEPGVSSPVRGDTAAIAQVGKDSPASGVGRPGLPDPVPVERTAPKSPVDSILAAAKPRDPVAVKPVDPEAGPAPVPADPPPTAPGIGGAPVESFPPASSSDFLNTGFEDEAGSCWNTRPASGVNRSGCGRFVNMGSRAFALSESGVSHGGRKAIQITYAKNEEFAGTDVGFKAETVNVRAFYYFDRGFDFGQGVKIGRVSSHNADAGLNDIDIILTVRSQQGGDQCGTTEMKDLALLFNGAPKGFDWGNISAPISFQRERWYAIEYQVQLNDPGLANGSVRLWVDGSLKAEKNGLRIRSGAAMLNTVKIGGWYSNAARGNKCVNPASPSRLYMDDVIVSQGFIGMR